MTGWLAVWWPMVALVVIVWALPAVGLLVEIFGSPVREDYR